MGVLGNGGVEYTLNIHWNSSPTLLKPRVSAGKNYQGLNHQERVGVKANSGGVKVTAPARSSCHRYLVWIDPCQESRLPETKCSRRIKSERLVSCLAARSGVSRVNRVDSSWEYKTSN